MNIDEFLSCAAEGMVKKLEVILGRHPGICWWKYGLVTSPSWAPDPNTKENEAFQHCDAVQLVLASGECSSPALTVFPSIFEPGSKRSVAAHTGWWQHSLCLINNFFLNYCVCKILKSDWFYESQLGTKSMTKINYVTDYRDYLPFHVFSSCFVLKPSFTTGTQLLSLFLRMYAIEDTSYILLRKVQLHTLAYTTYFKASWIIAPSKNLSCCLSLMPEFLNLDTTDMLDWIILCCDGEWKRFSPLWEV